MLSRSLNSLVSTAGCKGGGAVSHGLSKASSQPFLILLLIPLLIFFFCFFTAASKNEVPLTGTQEPGATFVTAQTGTVPLAEL